MLKIYALCITFISIVILSSCAKPLSNNALLSSASVPVKLSIDVDRLVVSDLIESIEGLEGYFDSGVRIESNRRGVEYRLNGYFMKNDVPTGYGSVLHVHVHVHDESNVIILAGRYLGIKFDKTYSRKNIEKPIKVTAVGISPMREKAIELAM